MERLEVVVRKETFLFKVLGIASLVIFILPLFTRPEYFYISAIGCGLSVFAMVVYLFSPKGKQLIAEVRDNTLAVRPLKDPLLGVGSFYQDEWRRFDLSAVTKISVRCVLSQADDYIRVAVCTESSSEKVFVRGKYREELMVFLKAVSARFPQIVLDGKL